MRSSSHGFTLIEIMIVIAIIAAVLAVGSQSLLNTNSQMRSSVRKIATVTRMMRNVSRLSSVTARLVVNMDDEKGHSYWVESTPGATLLKTEEQEKELERLTDIQREDMEKKSSFKLETRIMKKPVKLPRGLFFESVEYTSRSKPVTAGKAFIHFLPSGLAEQAAIHITDKKTLNWTIEINPLTGKANLYERKLTLKELEQL
jgi:prepilin-type N-terminal cleavage/methylation domain-containing protein